MMEDICHPKTAGGIQRNLCDEGHRTPDPLGVSEIWQGGDRSSKRNDRRRKSGKDKETIIKPIWPDDYLIPGFPPYHVEDAGIIYCADCRDILPYLPNVDVVITDPPYGLDINYESFDDSKDNVINLISQFYPLLRSDLIAIFPGVHGIYWYPKPDWVMCWCYEPGNTYGKFGFSSWQPILIYGKCPYMHNGKGCRSDVIVDLITGINRTGHPCPKSLSLMKKLVNRLSIDSEDIILDPFIGSGTTLSACKELNRKFIGIEIEEKYCEIAVKRLRQGVLNFV